MEALGAVKWRRIWGTRQAWGRGDGTRVVSQARCGAEPVHFGHRAQACWGEMWPSATTTDRPVRPPHHDDLPRNAEKTPTKIGDRREQVEIGSRHCYLTVYSGKFSLQAQLAAQAPDTSLPSIPHFHNGYSAYPLLFPWLNDDAGRGVSFCRLLESLWR